MGHVGRAVAARLTAFDAEVLYTSRVPKPELDLPWVSLDDLVRTSDVVSLHVSLTAQTRGMIGARELGLMKRSALLINTSRGPIVDQKALLDALQRGTIAGAGLDVLEPRAAVQRLAALRTGQRLVHAARRGSAVEVWPRVVATCFANIEHVAHGQPPQHLAVPRCRR